MPDEKTPTVKCPLCHEIVEIPDYDYLKKTRSDALRDHLLSTRHVGGALPSLPTEGPPLPRSLGVRWPDFKPPGRR